jgi:hypothetical protein
MLIFIVLALGILNPSELHGRQLDFNLEVMVILLKEYDSWPPGSYTCVIQIVQCPAGRG